MSVVVASATSLIDSGAASSIWSAAGSQQCCHPSAENIERVIDDDRRGRVADERHRDPGDEPVHCEDLIGQVPVDSGQPVVPPDGKNGVENRAGPQRLMKRHRAGMPSEHTEQIVIVALQGLTSGLLVTIFTISGQKRDGRA